MSGLFRPRRLRLREAGRECRAAAEAWSVLRDEDLSAFLAVLPEAEVRHLRHTVFRINALLALYASLRRATHDTRLGVLLGAITHLLDFAYDHGERQAAPGGFSLGAAEGSVFLAATSDETDGLEAALALLARRAWGAVANRDEVQRRLVRMLETQRESLKQVEVQGGIAPGVPRTMLGDQENARCLDVDALWRITRRKGHDSLCLYFSAVNPSFGPQEEAAIASLGAYMQYMDDLEDYYEDVADGRRSPVAGPWAGVVTASGLFFPAARDLYSFYGEYPDVFRPRAFIAWLALFHLGVVVGTLSREVTRRLPGGLQRGLIAAQEMATSKFPFLEVAPVPGILHGGFAELSSVER